MNYLYHMVPQGMVGTILYPLSKLKEKHPRIYKEQIKKYDGRKFILGRKVKFLDCLPAEVLNLTAVHPRKIKNAFRKANVPLRKLRWFKINPYNLDSKLAVVYLYKYDLWKDADKLDNYEQFNPTQLSMYNKISNKTIRYYRDEFHNKGIRPLLFHLVPHILYNGTIDTKKCEVIEV